MLPGGKDGVGDWDVNCFIGYSRCKLLYIRWRNKKVLLLYRTENYIQYPVISGNGKEYEKDLCICVTGSLCCVAVINMIL